jgi:hypothetical protein
MNLDSDHKKIILKFQILIESKGKATQILTWPKLLKNI